eukprot:TRINITY_DN1814_c0_g1_i8.p1 TRINITY_DN1814_c0_g1~~TRINITY_DN1814_c0_g1_i8.p1  ORF type:complete len:573 (+),score=117.46 TRINITY_DN1814_c0_g1_i8:66-1784(+)
MCIRDSNYSTRYAEILKLGVQDPTLLDENSRRVEEKTTNLRIGIVFNGRQSPGGHAIVAGLLEYTKRNKGVLYGFVNGTQGLFKEQAILIDDKNFWCFHNQGGYHFLGRSQDKVRTQKELEATAATCQDLNLDGLVLVGASHTLTDCLVLSEHCLNSGIKTRIIGIPCTVDGNVYHPMLESVVGFDSSSKVYSQLIGNIMTDAASAIKYWYFIRLMGRDPSHLVLEAALQTHPNMVIISEEVANKGQTIKDVVSDICDLIVERANAGKNFGTILIPEGLPHYLPNLRILIDDLNNFLQGVPTTQEKNEAARRLFSDPEYVKTNLTPWSAAVFNDLPEFTRKQLLLERDTSGSIQLTQIETEKLFAHLVAQELKKRKAQNKYNGSFNSITHFFGYQGRCSFPSQFDCELGNTYGFTAGVLIESQLTGYCVSIRGLTADISGWFCGGIPLVSMTHVKSKSSYGINKAIITSSEVDLRKGPFLRLKDQREGWRLIDHYTNPGPIQFTGPMRDQKTLSLRYLQQNYLTALKKVEQLLESVRRQCRFGTQEPLLEAAISNLTSLNNILSLFQDRLKQ